MRQRLFPFVLAAGVVILDRITKGIIKSSVALWDRPRDVIPGFFDIVHTENPGIAFGLLADSVRSVAQRAADRILVRRAGGDRWGVAAERFTKCAPSIRNGAGAGRRVRKSV